MLKKFIRKLLVMTLVLMLISSNLAFAAEQEKYLPAEKVFTQEKVENLEKQIDKKVLEMDKDNGFSISPQAVGTYPRRKGVILVTGDKLKGIIPTGHAAIVYAYGTVVESLSGGVTTGANDWYQTRTTCYGVTVIGTTVAQDETAANWCYGKRGLPYNWNYLNPYTRSSFYCSQLVYAAFLDNYGINLDTGDFGVAVHPMELVNTSRTSLIYQK